MPWVIAELNSEASPGWSARYSKKLLPENYWEGGLAGANRFVELSEWAPKKGSGQKQGAITLRLGMICA
jgi:hypothetical protein